MEDKPTPSGLRPQDLEVAEWYDKWLKAAKAALETMEKGEDPLDGPLRLFTSAVASGASRQYPSFDRSRFLAVVESVILWRLGDRTNERLVKTWSLIENAKFEFVNIFAPPVRPDPPPIICTQAELGRIFDLGTRYAHLPERLKKDGRIKDYEQTAPHRLKVWFATWEEYERAREKLEKIRT
jgi:hypothetical protein